MSTAPTTAERGNAPQSLFFAPRYSVVNYLGDKRQATDYKIVKLVYIILQVVAAVLETVKNIALLPFYAVERLVRGAPEEAPQEERGVPSVPAARVPAAPPAAAAPTGTVQKLPAAAASAPAQQQATAAAAAPTAPAQQPVAAAEAAAATPPRRHRTPARVHFAVDQPAASAASAAAASAEDSKKPPTTGAPAHCAGSGAGPAVRATHSRRRESARLPRRS